MSEQKPHKKTALVPRLRFPEFREAGEWEAGKVEGVISTVTPPKKLLTSEYLGEGCFPVIDQSQKEIAGWTNDAEAIIKNNLPLIIFGDHTCTLKIARQPFSQGADGIKILRATFSLKTEYLYQCLQFNPVAMEEYKRHFSTLKNKTVCYPISFVEQQKIADCLSSLDELITAENQKLDALKTHKNGLMQQFFPREGETLPRLRFPEFRDMPEWSEKNLGEVCKIQRGKFSHRPRNDPRFFGGKYPFIQTGDVVKSNGGSVQASQTLNELGLGFSKLFKPPIILITIAANIGDTGLLDSEACFTDSVAGLIPNRGVSAVFLELAVRGKKEHLNMIAPAAAQKNINSEILSALPVFMPSFDEQQRIASCLASLNDLITVQTQKVDALKTHKKGLMQQLFPVMEEVEA